MAAFNCPTCKTDRHITSPYDGIAIEKTGETPTQDVCWYCGTPVEPALGATKRKARR